VFALSDAAAVPLRARSVPPPDVLRRVMFRLKPDAKDRFERSVLLESGLFEPAWYLQRYPDVAEDGADPALHYLRHGAAEGRDPGQDFSTANYFHDHPDVAKARLNPVVHYALYGHGEGRRVRRPASDSPIVSSLCDPTFDLRILPESCLPVTETACRDLGIGPVARNGGVRVSRAELLGALATRPPARLVIDWDGVQREPGEWAGLWGLDDMTLNRQIMDACRIARDRRWRIAVRGPVQSAQAPLYGTVAGLVGQVIPTADECEP